MFLNVLKFGLAVAVIIVLLGWCFSMVSCTEPDATKKVLEDQGYTNVVPGEWNGWACGQGDGYATSFTAISPAGKPVSGTVCSGVNKQYTIRFAFSK